MISLTSKIILAVTLSVIAVQSMAAQGRRTNQSTATQSRLREINRQYQNLVKELQIEQANIFKKQADYAFENLKETQDLIGDFIGIIKDTPPGEKPPEDLNHYYEFLKKCTDLMRTAFETLNHIADSNIVLNEKEAQIGRLNQRLAEANVALRSHSHTKKSAKNSKSKTRDLAKPREDWTALDEAIENMRREDQAFLEAENQQLLNQQSQQEEDLAKQLEQLRKRARESEQEAEQAKAELKQEQERATASGRGARWKTKIRIPIPADWVPCQCPAAHPGAGIVDENGTQWHTPLLRCP